MARRLCFAAVLSLGLLCAMVARASIECRDGAERMRETHGDELDVFCALRVAPNVLLRHGVYRRVRTRSERSQRPMVIESGQFWRGHKIGRWLLLKDHRYEEQVFEDSIPSGVWEEWHADGGRRALGRFEQGRRTGLWREWDDSGCLASETRYANGTPVGIVRSWHGGCAGQLASEERFVAGRREGRATQWSPSGQLLREEWFRRGRRHGVLREYFSAGKPKLDATYRNGRRDGTETRWEWNSAESAFVRSSLSLYRDGRLLERQQFCRDGLTRTIDFERRGAPGTGIARLLSCEGTEYEREELVDGRRHGISTSYGVDPRTRGTPSPFRYATIEFRDGEPTGEARFWHGNGVLALVGAVHGFAPGRSPRDPPAVPQAYELAWHGLRRAFDADGSVRCVSAYIHGHRFSEQAWRDGAVLPGKRCRGSQIPERFGRRSGPDR